MRVSLFWRLGLIYLALVLAVFTGVYWFSATRVPSDVAAAVRFLCSPSARYINGQAIHANGGAYLGA